VLAGSRTMNCGVAACMAPLAAAGVDVAQNILPETQPLIPPLIQYFDMLRGVLIAVPLGGIAVTIYARLDDWKRRRR